MNGKFAQKTDGRRLGRKKGVARNGPEVQCSPIFPLRVVEGGGWYEGCDGVEYFSGLCSWSSFNPTRNAAQMRKVDIYVYIDSLLQRQAFQWCMELLKYCSSPCCAGPSYFLLQLDCRYLTYGL